ncbi:MAG: hypothetical protein U9R56_01310 [candidate division Zixibacteria bacterium]|nr:hypothetical protein [candidate division Zixibacteria bacterium]
MNKLFRCILIAGLVLVISSGLKAQNDFSGAQSSLYDVPPRWLIDMPTAGTLPRGYFNICFRFYPNGGTLASTDIGLSHRFMLGISFGGEGVLSTDDPDWNSRFEFSTKFRIIDEMEFFPAVTAGFSSQGFGAWDSDFERYQYKSRGFYAVVSRSFYFYSWTSGWHAGINYSLENEIDNDNNINFFGGFDATFKYNLALLLEYDAAFNDDWSDLPEGMKDKEKYSGKRYGYLNCAIKWLFAENLEIEFLIKDLLVNRRESSTFSRGVRLTYIDSF